MNPLFNQIDDQLLMKIFYVILGKSGSINIVRFYDEYIVEHVGLRRSNEEIGDRTVFQIENDLSISFDSNYLNNDEQERVIKFLRKSGFSINI